VAISASKRLSSLEQEVGWATSRVTLVPIGLIRCHLHLPACLLKVRAVSRPAATSAAHLPADGTLSQLVSNDWRRAFRPPPLDARTAAASASAPNTLLRFEALESAWSVLVAARLRSGACLSRIGPLR